MDDAPHFKMKPDLCKSPKRDTEEAEKEWALWLKWTYLSTNRNQDGVAGVVGDHKRETDVFWGNGKSHNQLG